MSDFIEQVRERVVAAAAARASVEIRGGGTKAFYGRVADEETQVLDMRDHAGVVNYEPTELVVTVRAGTPLVELEALLAEQNQMLAFEPPHFGPGATVGGCVAAGLSGPRRVAAGAARDFVLGVKMMDGRGDVLSFGGQVMKNVAGYDVSRLVAGSLGTLGPILEVSLKVLPRPLAETTLRLPMGEAEAIDRLNEWGGQPLPISASAWYGDVLSLRLSGAEAAVSAAVRRLGGDALGPEEAERFWRGLRDQTAPLFGVSDAPDAEDGALWRLSVPSAAAPLKIPGDQLMEWSGALRWLRTGQSAEAIRGRVAELGGHATLFRGGDRRGEVFHPLPAPLLAIHRRLKDAFDPAGIFNPGRMYSGI